MQQVHSDHKLYKILHRLTLEDGKMQNESRHPSSQRHAWIAYRNDKVVGWALQFPPGLKKLRMTYFYVDAEYRRCGIGSALLGAINADVEHTHGIRVCPWDDASVAFFKKAKKQMQCDVEFFEI